MTNWEYVPGTVYPVNVTVTRTGTSKFGFGFEALQSNGTNGGSLSITNGVKTQLKNAVVAGNIRTNVVHRNNGGLSANSHTFSFIWTAPVTNIGNITFYTAGNAANGFNNTAGDFIFTSSQIITPSTVGLNDEHEIISSMSVYPNPVSDLVSVELNTRNSSDIQIHIVDITGSVVQVFNFTKPGTGHRVFENTIGEDIKNGVYILQAVAGAQTVSKRIVVIR
jgi:hypothetical protein